MCVEENGVCMAAREMCSLSQESRWTMEGSPLFSRNEESQCGQQPFLFLSTREC